MQFSFLSVYKVRILVAQNTSENSWISLVAHVYFCNGVANPFCCFALFVRTVVHLTSHTQTVSRTRFDSWVCAPIENSFHHSLVRVLRMHVSDNHASTPPRTRFFKDVRLLINVCVFIHSRTGTTSRRLPLSFVLVRDC